MSTFSYQGDPTQYGNNNRTLPKDQQKLADAAAYQGNAEGAGVQGVAERTGNLVDIASYGSLLNKGVDMFTKYNPKALLRSASAVNSADGTAMKLLRSAGRATLGTGKGPSRAMPRAAGLATVANIGSEVFRAFDEKERSGYQALGEAAGEKFGEAIYGDGNLGPITPSERRAIDAGLNPNKPIENPMGLSTITGKYGAGNNDNVTGYEPMAQKSEEELATAATENYAAQFSGAAQNKDGGYTGYLASGGKQSMTPEQYASFAEQQRLGLGNQGALPMGDYTPVAGTQGFVQQPLGYTQQAPQAPQAPAPRAPQVSNQMVASANFRNAQEAGTITPEKVQAAKEYAASMGREFDPKMGYTKEFDPSILAKYNAERNASQQGGQQDIQQDQGLSNYARESAAREARMDARPDFGSAQIRDSSGKMVEATEENRAQRDLVTGLKQEAREAGYTPQQTRTYVADKLKERKQADEDRVTQKEMDELNMTNTQVQLQSRIAEMMPKPDEMSREDYFGFVKGLDSMGISVDSRTGNLTSVDEKFLRPDGEINLGPDSDLFQKISQMKGGESFLAAPKDVKEFASNQPAGARVRATDGTQRVWEVQEGGDLVQVL